MAAAGRFLGRSFSFNDRLCLRCKRGYYGLFLGLGSGLGKARDRKLRLRKRETDFVTDDGFYLLLQLSNLAVCFSTLGKENEEVAVGELSGTIAASDCLWSVERDDKGNAVAGTDCLRTGEQADE